MAEITTKDLPTAEENPEAWNILWVAGLPVPGTCLPIEGERKRDVEHKKSKGSTRDILVDQGMQPTECTIKIRTNDATTFRSLYDFYVKYMSPDRVLSRLNVIDVYHPQLYSRGITQAYFYAAPLPQPTAQGGIRPYISVFRFKIVGPKTQIGDSSKSKKPQKSPSKVGDDSNKYFAPSLQVGVSLISSQSNLPNISIDPKTQPVAQKQVLYTPVDINKLGQSGDITASFVSSIGTKAVPPK